MQHHPNLWYHTFSACYFKSHCRSNQSTVAASFVSISKFSGAIIMVMDEQLNKGLMPPFSNDISGHLQEGYTSVFVCNYHYLGVSCIKQKHDFNQNTSLTSDVHVEAMNLQKLVEADFRENTPDCRLMTLVLKLQWKSCLI